jgi:hypothetical protein
MNRPMLACLCLALLPFAGLSADLGGVAAADRDDSEEWGKDREYHHSQSDWQKVPHLDPAWRFKLQETGNGGLRLKRVVKGDHWKDWQDLEFECDWSQPYAKDYSELPKKLATGAASCWSTEDVPMHDGTAHRIVLAFVQPDGAKKRQLALYAPHEKDWNPSLAGANAAVEQEPIKNLHKTGYAHYEH